MQSIEKDGVQYAIIHRKEDWKEGLDFLTPNETFCQVGTWWYQKGKQLKAHRHIHYERSNTVTQECVNIVTGSMRVDFYDDNNESFRSEVVQAGDLLIILNGGHSYEILDNDTKIVECKNGPFISVERDKELI